MTAVVIALLSWGVIAFGGVYPWGYAPLLAGCALVGVWALAHRTRSRPLGHAPIEIALGALIIAVLAQLLPVPTTLLKALSPATDALLTQLDLSYASGGVHPISIQPAATWLGLAFLISLSLLFVGLSRALTPPRTEAIAAAISVLGSIVALAGIVQKPLSSSEIYGFWQPQHHGANVFGPFVNRNHFAGWMIMAIPVVGGYYIGLVSRSWRSVKPTWRERLLWLGTSSGSRAQLVGAAIGVMSLSVLLTSSRSGFFCLALALAGLRWLVLRTETDRFLRTGLRLFLGLIAVASAAWAGLDTLVARFSGGDGSLLGGRDVPWALAGAIVRDFALAGTGLNTYDAASPFYQAGRFEFHFSEAHSDYLQLASEGGLLLTIPTIALAATFGRIVWRRFSVKDANRMDRCIRFGAVVGLTTMAVQEMVEFSLQVPGNAVLFVLLASIAIYDTASPGARRGPIRGRTPDEPCYDDD